MRQARAEVGAVTLLFAESKLNSAATRPKMSSPVPRWITVNWRFCPLHRPLSKKIRECQKYFKRVSCKQRDDPYKRFWEMELAPLAPQASPSFSKDGKPKPYFPNFTTYPFCRSLRLIPLLPLRMISITSFFVIFCSVIHALRTKQRRSVLGISRIFCLFCANSIGNWTKIVKTAIQSTTYIYMLCYAGGNFYFAITT